MKLRPITLEARRLAIECQKELGITLTDTQLKSLRYYLRRAFIAGSTLSRKEDK